MSGSIVSAAYDLNDGTQCYINCDESNLEGAIVTPVRIDASNKAARKNQPPKNIRERYGLFKSDTSTKTRIVYYQTNAQYIDADTGAFSLTNETFVEALTGETFRFDRAYSEQRTGTPTVGDTGELDGDNP